MAMIGTLHYQGVDAEGFHLPPRSSCCDAPVVVQRRSRFGRYLGEFVPLNDEDVEVNNPRCGRCNRELS